MPERKPAQRGRRILRKDNHFTGSVRWRCRDPHTVRTRGMWRKRGGKIFEYGDIVISMRELCRKLRRFSGRQRIVLRWRKKRPILAIACKRDPFASQRVPAKMRIRDARGVGRARSGDAFRDRGMGIEPKFSSIGFKKLSFVDIQFLAPGTDLLQLQPISRIHRPPRILVYSC